MAMAAVAAFTCFHPKFPSFTAKNHHRFLPLPPFRCSAVLLAGKDESAKFAEAARRRGNLVPLYRCIFSDQLTPVLAYRCLVKEDDFESPSFIFEAVEQRFHGSNVGRYSVVGAQPAVEIVAKENVVSIMDHEEGHRTNELVADLMQIPMRISKGWTQQFLDELPDVFCGGWIGYFSYGTVRYVEKDKVSFSEVLEDERNLPDAHLGLYNDVIVFDHVEKKAYVIHWVRLDRFSSIEDAYQDGKKRLERLLSVVHDIDAPKLSAGSIKVQTHQFATTLKISSVTSKGYRKAVIQAKEDILGGNISQIVLSQHFERRTLADPFEVYRALRTVNHSPYTSYLQARGCIILASGPEILTHVNKRKVINQPLARTVKRGSTDQMLENLLRNDDQPLARTFKRGSTEDEHQMLENLLLNDEKRCARHIVLDMGHSDIGKVVKPDMVEVAKLMDINRYSHLMHTSPRINGEHSDQLTRWDALLATLSLGAVNGTSKVMDSIDHLEVTKLGTYSGGFGSISFSGHMDISIASRTIAFPAGVRYDSLYSYKDINRRQEWVAHLQTGAGIEADSNPDDEQRECENKFAAMARAIDLAECTFVDKS